MLSLPAWSSALGHLSRWDLLQVRAHPAVYFHPVLSWGLSNWAMTLEQHCREGFSSWGTTLPTHAGCGQWLTCSLVILSPSAWSLGHLSRWDLLQVRAHPAVYFHPVLSWGLSNWAMTLEQHCREGFSSWGTTLPNTCRLRPVVNMLPGRTFPVRLVARSPFSLGSAASSSSSGGLFSSGSVVGTQQLGDDA